MRGKILLSSLVATLIFGLSCTTDDPALSPEDRTNLGTMKKHEQLKESFGKALAKSLFQSESLRNLVRTEALEKFDNDFDVLYHLIKNKNLDGGVTVRELIISNMVRAEDLTFIEKEIPLLTIFVPELPENGFSAEKWKIKTEIPIVAIESKLSNDVKMIDSDQSEFLLASSYIPDFPVVVVKENERIVVSPNELRNQKRSRVLSSGKLNDIEFEFLSDCFDKTQNTSRSKRITTSLDQVIKDAYTIYESADGWQRDYIYYGITPSSPNGPFSYDFQEHITTFSMNGSTPQTAYSKIADQSGDPQMKDGFFGTPSSPSQSSGWTGGSYEFKVRVLFNSKNGLGSEFITYFDATPLELFELSYQRSMLFGRYFWTPTVSSLKTKNLNLPLFNWDLNDYATTIKIEIEEIDQTITTTTTESGSVKFATNFSIDGQTLKKIGLKFGASLEQTQSQTTTRTFTQGNDLLGSVIINFADKVVIDDIFAFSLIHYETRIYSTGWFKIGVEPKRVQ